MAVNFSKLSNFRKEYCSRFLTLLKLMNEPLKFLSFCIYATQISTNRLFKRFRLKRPFEKLWNEKIKIDAILMIKK